MPRLNDLSLRGRRFLVGLGRLTPSNELVRVSFRGCTLMGDALPAEVSERWTLDLSGEIKVDLGLLPGLVERMVSSSEDKGYRLWVWHGGSLVGRFVSPEFKE
jgi:hypothetical protein